MPNPPSLGLPHPQHYDLSNVDLVVDEVTRLVWQRRIDPKKHTWADAHAYCRALALAGQHDWRVPSLAELVSIIDPTRVEPGIDSLAFPNTPNLPFWTSQNLNYNSGLAWYVFFGTGGAYAGNDVGDEQPVRCVRGGPPPAGICYDLNETIVHDRRTGLTWQRRVDAPARSWENAKAQCAAFAPSGEPFRLPTVKELMTIVDVTRADPATDVRAFDETPAEFFWSSSEAPSLDKAWGVNFASGASGLASKAFAARVRCTR